MKRRARECIFERKRNATGISKEIRSVYGKGVITDQQVLYNWFAKLHSGDTSLEDEPTSDFDNEAKRQTSCDWMTLVRLDRSVSC